MRAVLRILPLPLAHRMLPIAPVVVLGVVSVVVPGSRYIRTEVLILLLQFPIFRDLMSSSCRSSSVLAQQTWLWLGNKCQLRSARRSSSNTRLLVSNSSFPRSALPNNPLPVVLMQLNLLLPWLRGSRSMVWMVLTSITRTRLLWTKATEVPRHGLLTLPMG